MNIESPRFGTLQIEPGKIIDFPRGLAGFEDNRRFSLFHPEEAAPKYFILQSLDDPEIAFQITDPVRLGFSYEIELNDEESALLKLADPGEIAVAVIVWRDADAGSDSDPRAALRASLKSPLLINTRERLGLQHVFTRLDCTLPNP